MRGYKISKDFLYYLVAQCTISKKKRRCKARNRFETESWTNKLSKVIKTLECHIVSDRDRAVKRIAECVHFWGCVSVLLVSVKSRFSSSGVSSMSGNSDARPWNKNVQKSVNSANNNNQVINLSSLVQGGAMECSQSVAGVIKHRKVEQYKSLIVCCFVGRHQLTIVSIDWKCLSVCVCCVCVLCVCVCLSVKSVSHVKFQVTHKSII